MSFLPYNRSWNSSDRAPSPTPSPTPFPKRPKRTTKYDDKYEAPSVLKTADACEECKSLYSEMVLDVISSDPCTVPVELTPTSWFNVVPVDKSELNRTIQYLDFVISRIKMFFTLSYSETVFPEELGEDINDNLNEYLIDPDSSCDYSMNNYYDMFDEITTEIDTVYENNQYCKMPAVKERLEDFMQELTTSELYFKTGIRYLHRGYGNPHEIVYKSENGNIYFKDYFSDLVDKYESNRDELKQSWRELEHTRYELSRLKRLIRQAEERWKDDFERILENVKELEEENREKQKKIDKDKEEMDKRKEEIDRMERNIE